MTSFSSPPSHRASSLPFFAFQNQSVFISVISGEVLVVALLGCVSIPDRDREVQGFCAEFNPVVVYLIEDNSFIKKYIAGEHIVFLKIKIRMAFWLRRCLLPAVK